MQFSEIPRRVFHSSNALHIEGREEKTMKRIAGIVIVIAAFAASMFVSSAYAEGFKCGGDLLTYDVVSLDHVPGYGVRCLWYNGQSPENFVWYGEGRWGQRTYRHVGIAFQDADSGPIGQAADLAGGDFNNNVTGLIFHATNGSWPSPNVIQVTGVWNELWTLRPNGVNYSPLPRPTACGDNFVAYNVSSLSGIPGSGLRCVLRMPGTQLIQEGSPPYVTAWFGNGQWEGRSYSHIGRISVTRGVPPNQEQRIIAGSGEATDICDPRFGQFCNSAPANSLQFVYRLCRSTTPPPPPVTFDFAGYDVIRAWNEHWKLAPDNLNLPDCQN
jgi:hypothetical protein